MCNVSGMLFFINNANIDEFQGKRVIEIGSKYVNGTVRPFIEKYLKPKEYIGVDIEPGRSVDIILPAENIVEYFGKESFDILISTELMEHVKDWKLIVKNFKDILIKDGLIYITTRSRGFPFHGHPFDFWRYELEDIREIFSDFEIILLNKDHSSPGVFFKAKKPKDYTPNNIDHIELYSILLRKRIKFIPNNLSIKKDQNFKKIRHFILRIIRYLDKKINPPKC
ncbi:MAG: methyltransferase domain-containing protein [Candidatus Hodarchaeota archaeon]